MNNSFCFLNHFKYTYRNLLTLLRYDGATKEEILPVITSVIQNKSLKVDMYGIPGASSETEFAECTLVFRVKLCNLTRSNLSAFLQVVRVIFLKGIEQNKDGKKFKYHPLPNLQQVYAINVNLIAAEENFHEVHLVFRTPVYANQKVFL